MKLKFGAAVRARVQETLRFMESNGKNHRPWSLAGMLNRFLLGRPLANWEGSAHEIRIGEAVPAKLYQAVAEVLAFVYRLKRKQA